MPEVSAEVTTEAVLLPHLLAQACLNLYFEVIMDSYEVGRRSQTEQCLPVEHHQSTSGHLRQGSDTCPIWTLVLSCHRYDFS